MKLKEIDQLPDGLLDAPATVLDELLGGPALLHLPGRQPEPLFVSILAHGNETTGLQALQQLLRQYRHGELPRALSVFFGNVAAAQQGLRRLEGQTDFNRAWPGTSTPDVPEALLMRQVMCSMEARNPFASIDIHNNTGINPHYACINRIDNRFLHLASLFSRTVVYFLRPLGVQSMAMSALCPAVTIECGKPDQEYGARHAADFMESVLRLHEFPAHAVAAHDIDLFHTVATVHVPEQVSFGFDETAVDLQLVANIDHLNFRELPTGTQLGRVHGARSTPLEVRDENDQPVFERYFRVEDGILRSARPFMPSMFTLDTRIIRQDCLGYLMERLFPEPVTSPRISRP